MPDLSALAHWLNERSTQRKVAKDAEFRGAIPLRAFVMFALKQVGADLYLYDFERGIIGLRIGLFRSMVFVCPVFWGVFSQQLGAVGVQAFS